MAGNNVSYKVRYCVIPSNLIFNFTNPRHMTVIAKHCDDWFDEKNDIIRDRIEELYIQKFNERVGHYADLEKSILNEGFRNPIMVTAGPPKHQNLSVVPPHLCENLNQLLISEYMGGSRLLIAQKLNLDIPCIVSDFVGRFQDAETLSDVKSIESKFLDKYHIAMSPRGVMAQPKSYSHINEANHTPKTQSITRRKIINEIIKDLKNEGLL